LPDTDKGGSGIGVDGVSGEGYGVLGDAESNTACRS
jgi:hypothetical protein